MNNNLVISYDEEGDLLEIRIGNASNCYAEDLGDEIFEFIDEKTGEIRGFDIFNFRRRTKNFKDIVIKLPSKSKILERI